MTHPDIARLEAQNRDIVALLREESKAREEIGNAVARIEERLRARKECPAPGLCVDLNTTVKDLVKDMQQIRGGWKTIGVLIAASSAVGGLLGYLFPRR